VRRLVGSEMCIRDRFYAAEEYHQDFFAKNPTQGYCLAVAVPKVNKVRARFSEYVTA
jgi:peptide-methionine (S)-S-oxide reductase